MIGPTLSLGRKSYRSHKWDGLLASLHVNILLKGVEVEQGQDLIPGVVGPVWGKHLLLDWTSIPRII